MKNRDLLLSLAMGFFFFRPVSGLEAVQPPPATLSTIPGVLPIAAPRIPGWVIRAERLPGTRGL